MAELFDYVDTRDVQLELNGFRLYGVDDFGVHWHTTFQQISGLFDGVASTLETSKKAWSDGYFANFPTREGRVITVDGIIYGACPEDLVKAWNAFKGVLSIHDQLLRIKLGGIELQTVVRQSPGAPIIQWNGLTNLKWSISLTALSSYLYASGQPTQGETHLPRVSGGFAYPDGGYNFEGQDNLSEWYFGEKQTSGIIRLQNPGNAPSPVTIRIDGPVVNPSFEHSPGGNVMSFNLTLGASSFLLVKGDTHEILLNGTAPLRGNVTRREWSVAVPGANSWSFSAENYDSEAKMTVSFRGAYL